MTRQLATSLRGLPDADDVETEILRETKQTINIVWRTAKLGTEGKIGRFVIDKKPYQQSVNVSFHSSVKLCITLCDSHTVTCD